MATSWASEHFCSGRVTMDCIMSIDDAMDYVASSECSGASPGYPLNQTYKTKKEALSDVTVRADLRLWWSKLGTNDVESVFLSLSLKDEILKSSKVASKKTRLFMAMPLFHHVAMVALCQKMHDRILSGGTWCTAGMDFHYGGWDSFLRSLIFERKFGADAEAYDMSICRILFSAALVVFKSLIPCSEHSKLDDLFAMALDSFCVTSRGLVLMKHTGNPSGWFLTLLLNTIIMYVLLAMTWIIKFPNTSRSHFEKMVRAGLVGDDSLVAVHYEIEDIFTAQAFTETWSIFGIKAKEEHSSCDVQYLEYCGATSVMLHGRWVRRPRVSKFIDALTFVQNTDPLYRLQRAVSIYHEMWPVPEREIALGYIDFLCDKYPWLRKHRRQYELSEAALDYLHTGLEGAACNEVRAKNRIVLQGSVRLDNMTKSKKQKARAKEARALVRAAAPTALGAGGALAGAVAKAAKKKAKKKKGSSWWGLLAGAAKTAAELAPMVAPVLLASHGPTVQNVQLHGQSAVAGGGGAAPIAVGASCATCTGTFGMKPKFGSDGRVVGVRLRGMDYVGALNVDSETSGTVLSTVDLNPFSAQWIGTQLQRQATLYERYRPVRIACMVEPSCPTTTAGQLIGFIDPDPDDDFSYTGRSAIQVASSHQGAEVSQIWQMNCAAYAFDQRTEDFYADADGSDARLISPGKWLILANTDMPASTAAGSLYIAWEYEFSITQLETTTMGSGQFAYLLVTGSPLVDATPLGTGTWSSILENGNIVNATLLTAGPNGSINHITGLPAGNYVIVGTLIGSSSPNLALACDGTNYKSAAGNGTMSNFNGFGAVGTTSDSYFHYGFSVTTYVQDVSEGWLSVTNSVGGSTATEIDFFLISIPDLAITLRRIRKRRTLQQIEAEVDRRLLLLEQAVASQVRAPIAAPAAGVRSSALPAALARR